MTWTLDLDPRGWDATVVRPLVVETPVLDLTNDPSDIPFDMFDDVVYMVQASPVLSFRFFTKDPGGVLAWMRSSPIRWELVQRLTKISWGVSLPSTDIALVVMPSVLQWPVANKWARITPYTNLAKWMPHEFSTVGHLGVCEDCGVGKHETPMHILNTPPTFKAVEHGA